MRRVLAVYIGDTIDLGFGLVNTKSTPFMPYKMGLHDILLGEVWHWHTVKIES